MGIYFADCRADHIDSPKQRAWNAGSEHVHDNPRCRLEAGP